MKSGLREGDIAGILLNRSTDLYIAMLAVLKTGPAYLPLDLSYPAERIRYILDDSKARCLLSHSAYNQLFIGIKTKVFRFDTELESIFSNNIKENLNINIDKTSSAYIIYTSGTTGLPKGVEISHSAFCNLILNEKRLYRLSSEEKVAQTFSPAFDASAEEIWMAFSTGSCLYPVSETVMHSGEELDSFILQHQITVLSTVPTMLSMMRPPLSSLKLLILGGSIALMR